MSPILKSFLLCLTLLGSPQTPASETDPPGRVGRISLAGEGVLLRIGDSTATGESAMNWPLTTGAAIETANGTRGEARIGSTALRIDGGATLEFLELSDERIWLRLNRGSIAIAVQNAEHAAEMALDTPQGRLRFDGPGSYRADVAGGTTAFSAYQGSASIEELGLSVRAGARILILGGDDRSYVVGQAAQDAFRQWALAREQGDARAQNRYVSPEMTGQEALEQHGHWQETAEYGSAWFPIGMPMDWAPYRWGRWVWVSPWGWTWIDQAPWGFAPFHYGRWALIGGRWAWLPGAYVARPVYAPALVVWLGQPGWTLSFSSGAAPAVGWYPLGPREVYYPYYRSSLRHVRIINTSHVRHADQVVTTTTPAAGFDRHYMHRHRNEAVTLAPQQAVQTGKMLQRLAAQPDSATLTSITATAPPPAIPKRQGDIRQPAIEAPTKPALPSPGLPSVRRLEPAYPPVQAAPPLPVPPPRRIEIPRPAPLPPVLPPQAHKPASAPAGAPGAAPPAIPQPQPRLETGRDHTPRIPPQRQDRGTEKKREAERGEPARPKHGMFDR